MSMRSVVFAPGERYHIYTRGVDKRPLFLDNNDYERFLMLLFTGNSSLPIHISRHTEGQGPALRKVFDQPRGEQFVSIGAYCLMNNHLHLELEEKTENGISAFMQKVGTGYTMYFNKKYERAGALFSSRFKARHIDSDQYFRRVINYIHANPAEFFEPDWKKGVVRNHEKLRQNLLSYRFSSFMDYENTGDRLESKILDKNSVLSILQEYPSFKSIMEDAEIFYRQEKDFEVGEAPVRPGLAV